MVIFLIHLRKLRPEITRKFRNIENNPVVVRVIQINKPIEKRDESYGYWEHIVDRELHKIGREKDDYDSIFINYSVGKMSPPIWRWEK